MVRKMEAKFEKFWEMSHLHTHQDLLPVKIFFEYLDNYSIPILTFRNRIKSFANFHIAASRAASRSCVAYCLQKDENKIHWNFLYAKFNQLIQGGLLLMFVNIVFYHLSILPRGISRR